MPFVQLGGKGSDVLVGGISTCSTETGLGLDLLYVDDDGPSLDVGEE